VGCVLEIQDGSQLTGGSNNFAVFTDTHVVPKPLHKFITNEWHSPVINKIERVYHLDTADGNL